MIKYNYTLKRSRRKTICIKISSDNAIQVLAPRGATIAEIEKIIKLKSDWIESHIRQNNQKIDRFRNVLAYKTILISGVEVPLLIGEKNLFSEDLVAVKDTSHLKKLFVDNLAVQFLSILDDIKQFYGFKCGKITFRSNKSRWGSCSASGDIAFNYKILMLPDDMQKYVIVHELCHTKVMNHSQKFYSEVKRVLPDYKVLIKKLKDYSPIIRLY